MALSSQSLKRSCHFGNNQNTHDNNNHGNNTTTFGGSKRICLGMNKNSLSYRSSIVCFSSSDNDNDLEDESCYRADQVKAKRRALTRMSFSVNPTISRAIAKYSDEDDDHYFNHQDSSEILKVDDNIDCKLTSNNSLKRRSISTSSFQLSDDFHTTANNTITNSPQTNYIVDVVQQSMSPSPLQTKKMIPYSDKNARSRCFEYLVGSIDEAWARYCNATSYEYEDGDVIQSAVTPASIATDDEDYFGNSTDITDYEDSDYGFNHSKNTNSTNSRSVSTTGKVQMFKPSSEADSSNNDPSSSQLQALKDRLTKAKYYLQDLVDSEDVNEVASFWKRWDMIKYATIELVEDDDDDEIVESTIEELEDGRFYVN